jgi:hypothetical protein
MIQLSNIAILQCLFFMLALIEQVMFLLFCKYPYKFGIPVFKCKLMFPDFKSIPVIDDQFSYIKQHLDCSDEFEYKTQSESKEIFIRSKRPFLNVSFSNSGLRCIGGTVFFKDEWKVTICVGAFACLFFINILALICFIGSVVDILIAVFAILLFMRPQFSEYRKLRRCLTTRIGANW